MSPIRRGMTTTMGGLLAAVLFALSLGAYVGLILFGVFWLVSGKLMLGVVSMAAVVIWSIMSGRDQGPRDIGI